METRARSKARKTTKKRTAVSRSRTPGGKRVSWAGTNNVIVAPGVGLGQACKTVLKTEFFANVAAAASGVYTGFLKPGSCFDPCGDIAAIQPALYDQWAATYGRYVVEKAYVKIEFTQQSAGTPPNYTFVAAAYPTINSTALGTYQAAASQAFAKSIMVGAIGDNTTSNSLVFRLDHAKVLGRKGMVTAEDNGALTGADPATGQYMVLPLFIQFVNAIAGSVTIRVIIYQTVHFDRRINVVDA